MREFQESVDWFLMALEKLSYKLPPGKLKGGLTLMKQCVKQYLHVKFPGRFRYRDLKNEGFYDKARCLSHLVHAYHMLNKRLLSLVPAFKLLDLAEKATCYNSYEVQIILFSL